MRYTKHLFTRIFHRCAAPVGIAFLCTGFAALGGCADETGEEGILPPSGSRIPLAIEVKADGFAGQPDDSPHTRSTEQSNYDTYFEPGDSLGLFAVKNIGTADASIMDGIDNAKMIFFRAEEADLNHTWRPEDASVTLYYSADVTYIAYYPYKDGITIDPTQSADAIRASFAKKTELQPSADQSSAEGYATSDLMTAGGKAVDTTDPAKKKLTLSLTHSYSLLVVKTNRNVKCAAPAGQGYTYHPQALAPMSDPGAADVTIQGVKARKIADGVFRAVVKPYSGNISGAYTTNGMLVKYDSPLAGSSVTAGKRSEYEVTTPMPGIIETRALQPGDFVYEHNGKIEIYPGDGPVDADGKIPEYEKAVGIVVTCDPARMTDTKCNEQGWNHAYVIGVERLPSKSGAPMTWEAGGSVTPTSLPPVSDSAAKNYMNGYADTQTMVDGKTPGEYSIFEAIVLYRNSHPVLTGIDRSPWFIPSIGQWVDVMINLCGVKDLEIDDAWSSTARELYEKVNTQFGKVGTDLLAAEQPDQLNLFWTSSEYSDETSFAWSFQGGINESECMMLLTPHHKTNFPANNSRHCARPFFAF